MSSDFLETVLAEKQREVERRRRLVPERVLQDLAGRRRAPKSFAEALRKGRTVAIITEFKKASPSAGTLRDDFDVQQIAQTYAANGAAAFSVLTDEKYFQGQLDHLAAVSRLNLRPVLRKDFIIDPYQIFEARSAGADAVLLIVAALAKQRLIDLKKLANDLGMDCVVEVHQEDELATALDIDAPMIGINNRNLKTLQISLETTERLAAMISNDRTIISESGIASKADIVRVARCGIHAVLVGTLLMRELDPGAALAEIAGVPRQ